ncbi:hypothetical protein QUH73_07305 [Labilibaculum sp. K2S]|uniref:hypothetical protein n=1 Tax=Labilibaculum sp. K2S TaxID=3056386 RepID=UPI0025A38F00|nr:hypothetical protein [Labilibaculum sp. K2S]MDM8159613.1 hypothetical protein [Labilibaculum sp. K2S]
MKIINLTGTFLFFFFTIFFVSCSDDDNSGLESIPSVATYKTTFKVALGYTYKVTDINTNQVLIDVDYGVADVKMLVYVIHQKKDGHYLKMGRVSPSKLQDITTDNIASVNDSLPKGKYHITFVACKDFQFVSGSTDIRTFLEPLTKDYNEAVMQVPNDYIHYATTEFEVTAPNGDDSPVFLNLKKMTTDLIFEFTDADKVPNPYDYQLTAGVDSIPSAFFIATGKTLTVKETEEKKLYLYSGEQDVPLVTDDNKKAVVTTFHTLSNDNLPVADRGRYWFEFKESANGGEQIKVASEDLDKFTSDHSSAMYIHGLYDEEQALVKSIGKTE